MIIRSIIILGVCATAVGCASVKETYAPDGRKAYALNCSGAARGWDKCFSAAGEICKDSGFDVLDRTSEGMAIGAASGYAAHGYANASGFGAATNERSMIVACKNSRVYTPQ